MQQTGQHAHPCRLKITASQVSKAYVNGADVFVIFTRPRSQSVTTEACLAAIQRVSEFDPSLVQYFRED